MIDASPLTASILTDDTLFIYIGPNDAWEVEHNFTTRAATTADVAAAVGWAAVERALRDAPAQTARWSGGAS